MRHNTYRIYSINHPGRLLNFWTLRVGAYSRWALIRINTVFQRFCVGSNGSGYPFEANCHPFEPLWLSARKNNSHPFERLELSVQNNTLIQEKTRNWVEARPKGPWRFLPVKTNAFSKMFWAFIRSPNQNGTLHQDPCKQNKTKTNHKTVLLPCATTSVEIPTINFRPILKQE